MESSGLGSKPAQSNLGALSPRLRLDIESGLVPEAKGDIFNPPSDTSGVRPLGPAGRTELEFIQPIYPISRGRQIKSAAENGVGVEEADLRRRPKPGRIRS